jgi:hypothetical protein
VEWSGIQWRGRGKWKERGDKEGEVEGERRLESGR